MSYWLFLAAVLLGMIGFQSVKSETTTPELEHQWPTGFKMNIRLQVLKKVTGGWTMTLRFTKPAPGLHIWRAKIVSVSKDKKVYKLKNMPWNPTLDKCSVLKMAFVADKGEQEKPAPEAFVEFLRKGECVCNSNLDETACSSTQKTNQPMTTSQKSQTSAGNRLPSVPPVGGQTTKATILDDWNIGFKMIFRFLIREPVNEGWIIRIKFSKPALHMQIWRSEIISVSDDKKTYFVRNMSYNKVLVKCTVLVIDFLAYKETLDESAPEADITFYRNGPAVPTSDNTACATTMPTRDLTTS